MKRISLILCLLLNYRPNRTLTKVQTPTEDLLPFVLTVQSKGFVFNSMIVSGIVVATSAAAMADSSDKIQVCIGLRESNEDGCLPAEDQILDDTNDVLYVIVDLGEGISRLIKEELTKSIGLLQLTKCVVTSVYHPPIVVNRYYGEHNACKTCQHLDTLICDSKHVGVLIRGRTLLRWADMLAYVEAHIRADYDRRAIRNMPMRRVPSLRYNEHSRGTISGPYQVITGVVIVSFLL